ncbi:Class II aldolase/adducin N-terminal [Penicillium bovifimosum]|uniref:Class II aldolase/adducin N-terminal n=1 Tax=Penicillium bovifimosum TaxID=126998 RepID=A0A9W9GHC3_9EURO|nr:Class II aldolase/adducin N-terminal [Penicillium bovifimosum]KAJ5120418.1 Class II aldolase/adducin N-terminal [Penicillium bovifimosum]
MAPSVDNGVATKPTGLAALSQGTPLPGIPKFENVDKQREYMLNHMAGAFRVFARHGFVEGMAGHISLRDPGNPHLFWTNPLGLHFGLIKPSDLILVNEEGEAVGGNMSRPANAAGFLIHSAIHKARPDVNAACHFHSTYGKAWSTFAQPLEMLNQDVAIFYGGAQSVYGEFGGVVLEEGESEALAKSLGGGKGIILRNHGLLTVGGTVDEAAYLFLLMEKSCQIQLVADAAAAAGRKKLYMDDEAARFTYDNTSDPESLFAEFQGYLQWESAISHDGYKAS